jgi:hypothetical protein
MKRSSFGLLLGAVLVSSAATLFVRPALADDSEKSDEASKEQSDKEKAAKAKPEAAAETPASLREDPHKSYYFVNARFRDIVVPKFMINMFASGGATVNVPTVGAEFTRRRDGVELNFAVSYADYSMNPFLFKGKSDGEESWELVSSSLKLVYGTIDLLYEIPVDDSGRFAFLIGGGVGIGGVSGSLYRNQVYPTNGTSINPSDPSSATKCAGPNDHANLRGSSGIPYCDSSNDHYGSYSEKSWANGGSLPLIFPWIALPQLSFRWKPIPQVQLRADVGFSTSGFYFGISGGYGLPIGGLAPGGGSSTPTTAMR